MEDIPSNAALNRRERAGRFPRRSLATREGAESSLEPDENLHAKILPALLGEVKQAASADHISTDELVRDAMERRLNERRRQSLYTYGEEQARKMALRKRT